jgi:hypothetical protein
MSRGNASYQLSTADLSFYACHRSLTDSSLDVRIAKNKSDRMSKPLFAINTGNVTAALNASKCLSTLRDEC